MCWVESAPELKLGRFTPAHKGQMELYLRWLDHHKRRAGEDSPIGLVLCSEKNREQVELLRLNEASIRVAEYLKELPQGDSWRPSYTKRSVSDSSDSKRGSNRERVEEPAARRCSACCRRSQAP